MSFPQIPKDPDAVLDYGFDWTDWLAGDTITASNWIVPAGITKISDDVLVGNQITRIWVSGGTAGTSYTITNRITTAQARTEDRSMVLVCDHR